MWALDLLAGCVARGTMSAVTVAQSQSINKCIKLSSDGRPELWEIEVLYEDADVVALNKPAGLPASPDPEDANRPGLMSLLHQGIAAGKKWALDRHWTYLACGNRLEAEASGVVLLARSKAVLTALANAFGSEKPYRRYITLARGETDEDRFEVTKGIGPNLARPGLMRIDSHHGKRARTIFEVLERFRGWTLVRCMPLTDRPHQVRVHLRSARLPLAGDAAYGGMALRLSSLKEGYHLKPGATERPLIGKPLLHLEEIELPHPVSNSALKINASWPKDLAVAVKYLERYAARDSAQKQLPDS